LGAGAFGGEDGDRMGFLGRVVLDEGISGVWGGWGARLGRGGGVERRGEAGGRGGGGCGIWKGEWELCVPLSEGCGGFADRGGDFGKVDETEQLRMCETLCLGKEAKCRNPKIGCIARWGIRYPVLPAGCFLHCGSLLKAFFLFFFLRLMERCIGRLNRRGGGRLEATLGKRSGGSTQAA